MSEPHVLIVLIYLAFMGLGTLLAVIRRRVRPNANGDSVWKKYPVYLLLNAAFLAAAWLPLAWHGLALLLAAIGAGASWEAGTALGFGRLGRTGLLLATAGLIASADWLPPANWLKLWLGVMLAAASASALVGERAALGRRVAGLAGGLVYLPVCLAAMLWLWHAASGDFFVTFLYLAVAASDAFGQFTGQLFGRRPLAPGISPAKTVEGAAGGLLFAALLGASLGWSVGWSPGQGALAGLAVGLAGLIGDLSESGWKRALGLKDFSRLMGAQGGVLDRFDSLIFAAPIFFLIVVR